MCWLLAFAAAAAAFVSFGNLYYRTGRSREQATWAILFSLAVFGQGLVVGWQVRPVPGDGPSMADRSTVASFAVYRQPSDDSPFVGSTIKSVYHRAGCRYAALMQHVRGYASEAEAQADGKTPCKECLK